MSTSKAPGQSFDEPPDRERVLALVLVSAAGYLPLIAQLRWQITAFVGAILSLRLAALRWPAASPGRLGLVGLMLAGGANCLLSYGSLAGQRGGTALFVTMLALKLMELRGARDLRVAGLLLWFLVTVQFLFHGSFGLVLYLGAVALAGVALQVELNGGMGERRFRSALLLAGRLGAQALPLAAVLFVLFPRLDGPLWSFQLDSPRAVAGMSDRMEPGSIGELVVDGELAFRARFDGPVPGTEELYWRGLVLWRPDERGWSPGHPPADGGDGTVRLVKAERLLEYDVLLEPSSRRWLYALDMPVGAPDGSRLTPDITLLADTPVTAARKLRLGSALTHRTRDPPSDVRGYALYLPPNVTQRMRVLAASWRESATDDWAVVQAGLRFFNREAFHYTLLPPRLGANPADEFLFETRAGFCEHYAGSFALLMRIAGIPSRIVLGYLGGEPNRVGGYHRIWQSDAHAWVEVAIPGLGWVRVDPTAAVNPARVDNAGASRLLGTRSAPARFALEDSGTLIGLIRHARMLADAIDLAWQDWVVDFSWEDQLALLRRLGLGEHRETVLTALMLGAGTLVMALSLAGLLRHGRESDRVSALYRELCRRLALAGLPRGAGEGPRDYGRRVAAARPDLSAAVGRFLDTYLAARYGPTPSADAERELATLLKAIGGKRFGLPGSPPRAT